MSNEELVTIIKDILATPKESEWIEFKANNGEPYAIGEYISALSNGAAYMDQPHGYLLWGIDDSNRSIVGTTFKPREHKIGNEELESWLKHQLNPKVDFTINETVFEGKRVVVFIIDTANDRPVAFKGEAYIRIGTYKKKLSEYPERARKIWTKTQGYRFEDHLAKTNLSENDVLRLIDYTTCFKLFGYPLPDNRLAILEKLSELRLIRRHPSGSLDITNLGALLFASDLSLFDNLNRKPVRLIYYKDNSRLHAEREIVGKKGYAVGFSGLINYINESLPVNEEISQAIRQETRMYPILAIREFIANALIHQDLSISGTGPMIEIFKNRIEITNPGQPLVDTLRFIDHAPISRNEIIAATMRKINICEERGSGIDRAVAQCELFQLPAPNFISADNYTKAILYSIKTMRQMNKEDKIRACYQHCCLKYVSAEPMTNESVRQRFGISA
ncbi:MAG: ATP-binding protein [Tidjanibacter sp.]|nr:ATP-binding protein [Tidjanibacter sp.]